MFRKLFAVLALIVSLTACGSTTAATTAPEPVDVVATEAAESWPAVDNQYAALVQCNYFLEAAADRDACVSAAVETFQPIAACAEEDSAGPCYWDATTRGNGAGESFTVDADCVVTLISAAL